MLRDVRGVAPLTGLIGLMAGIALIAAGCSSGPGSSTARTSRPDFGLGTGPTTTADAEAAALAAYRAWWDTFIVVARDPDPDSPRLAEHATGKQLIKDRADLAQYRQAQRSVVGEVRLKPTVTQLAPRRAVIRDCVDSSAWVEVEASGRTIPNLSPNPDGYTVTLIRERDQGPWKVSESVVRRNRC